jgi:two-component system cell cycle response regulator CpdR
VATILLVDDEEALRNAVAKMLRRAGHIVVTASNGIEGVALFRSSPNRFDIVLTDLQMPEIDGYQLVTLVRETSSLAKIICMSGATDKPVPTNTEFLRKPFEMAALHICVGRLLKQG